MTQFVALRSGASGPALIANDQDDVPLWDVATQKWYTGPAPGAGSVDSVFGRLGVVVAATGDYDSDQVDNVSSVAGASVSDALDFLLANAGNVDSVFGRIGVVVAASGDYDSDQVDNVSGVVGASVSDALDANATAAATAQTTANAAGTAAATAQTTANAAGTAAATAQTTANSAVTAAATADAKAVAAQQPFKATYYVDPAFAGTSTGSGSNPFTTVAAAFAYAASLGISSFVVKLPPGVTITENIVYPPTGGQIEISSDQVLAGSVGSRITGNLTWDVTSGSLRAKLTNIVLVGNITGNAASGAVGFVRLTAVRHTGTVNLTVAGTGVWVVALRGLGSADANKAGGSTSGLVSVAGRIDATNWVLEGGFNEAATATTPYPGSQFQACWFGSTSGSPIPIGLNGASLNTAFYDSIFVGPTTFTAGVADYTVFLDGASLASLNNSIAGTILVGTRLQLKTLNANASAVSTVVNNVGSTAYGSRSPAGLYAVDVSLTLNAAGTLGALQHNVIYTDSTGTLVTAAVGGTLNIAGAVGSKISATLVFEHNGAAAAIAFSFTGVTTPGAMSVSHISAVRRLN